MKLPEPKPRRVQSYGLNSVSVKNCYTKQQMKECWDASRREALDDVIERTKQWGALGIHFSLEIEGMKND